MNNLHHIFSNNILLKVLLFFFCKKRWNNKKPIIRGFIYMKVVDDVKYKINFQKIGPYICKLNYLKG